MTSCLRYPQCWQKWKKFSYWFIYPLHGSWTRAGQ